jgi:radical SAM superfamily enzyme YgiQ (UPF0313 family)
MAGLADGGGIGYRREQESPGDFPCFGSMVAMASASPVTRDPIDAPAMLRADSGVLLVSCYELGHQPLALAAPLALLRRAGFSPTAVDTAVEPLTNAEISAARFIAIAVPMHTALRLGTRVAERARRVNPAAHICFYGLYASLNADFLLRRCADSVIAGEFEAPLLALLEALDRGLPAESVPDALRQVVPSRDGLPGLRSYAGLERDGVIVPAGYVETTRGCHHECRHCPIPPIYGGRFVVVPREVVLADARAQIAAGARHLTFGDPDFFNGPGHGLRIARALREEFPFLTFDATIKIEHVLQHRARLSELADLGCAFVVSAVESVNPTVLDKLAKGHGRTDIETALALLDAVGVPMRPSLMPFSPWETLDSYLELLGFVADRDLIDAVDPVHFSIRLLVPPGSLLLADPTSAEWLGELDPANFTYRWRHPDPRMDELQVAVASIAEDAAASNESATATFARIWGAAHATAGRVAPPLPPTGRRSRPPRLTESWFC